MNAICWVTLVVGILWVVLFARNVYEYVTTEQLRPRADFISRAFPKVSIIVPVRNEEVNLTGCLESLLAQEQVDIEVIIVDDCSTDETLSLAKRIEREDLRVRVVQAAEPPVGWTGKCHAIVSGIEKGVPRGEWFLFTDADTRHHPKSLVTSLDYALNKGVDLLSLAPRLKCDTFWERLVQPAVAALIGLFNPPSKINHPTRPWPFANGQYMLIRGKTYFDVGGFRAVAGKVLEDVELARKIVNLGYRIRFVMGRGLFSTRMYDSLVSLVEGWTKNFYMILEAKRLRIFIAAFVALFFSGWPFIIGWVAFVSLVIGKPLWNTTATFFLVGVYLLVLTFQAVLRGINQWYCHYALLAFLGNIMASFILLRSTWLHRTKRGVVWKGRRLLDQEEHD